MAVLYYSMWGHSVVIHIHLFDISNQKPTDEDGQNLS